MPRSHASGHRPAHRARRRGLHRGRRTRTFRLTSATTGLIAMVVAMFAAPVVALQINASASDRPKAPDLIVEKTASPERVHLGGEVIWTVEVRNAGGAAAEDVEVEDVLPDGLDLVSTDPPGALVDDVWSVGTLEPGDNDTLVITTRATRTGELTNVACASTSTPEPDTSYNCAEDTVIVEPDVNLTIQKVQRESTPNPRPVGSTVEYDIVVSNLGESPADDVRFADEVPAGLDVQSAAGTGWSCDIVGQLVDCVYGPVLAAGADAPAVTITAIVTEALLGAEPVTNLACVIPAGEDAQDAYDDAAGKPGNPLCDDAETTFPGGGSLTIVKTNDPTADTTLAFGDTITYRLTVTATGQVGQSDVVVRDDIPGYGANSDSIPTTYVPGSATCVEPPAITATNCVVETTVVGGEVRSIRWELGDLAPGASRTVTFAVTIDVAAGDTEGDVLLVTNAGSARSDETPDKPSNEVENPVRVVVAVGDTDSDCVDDTPRFSFVSRGWLASQEVTLHLLDKDGNQVETRTVTADRTGLIESTQVWPGFSVDPDTGVKTYPGLDVRPLKFYLSGPPETRVVTVQYPPAAEKCDVPLSITKSNDPTGTVDIGDTITYTLTVKVPENGSFNQEDVVVTDHIPGYDPDQPDSGTTTYVAKSARCVGDLLPDIGRCDIDLTRDDAGKVTRITWQLGSMEPGQSLDLEFRVTADDQPGATERFVKLYNVGTVESKYWPPTPSNRVVNDLDLADVLPRRIPQEPPGTLPTTGSNLFRTLDIGAALLVAGLLLTHAARRRVVRPGDGGAD